jgi:hypothetical protein
MKFNVNEAPVLKVVEGQVYDLVIVSAVDSKTEKKSNVYCQEATTGYTALLTLSMNNAFKARDLARALKIKGTLDTLDKKLQGKKFRATLTQGDNLAFVQSIR